jgi:predicted Zn-ribbon and HTH transcriptional regulator
MRARRKLSDTRARRDLLYLREKKGDEGYIVEPPPLKCPACKSNNLRVTKTIPTEPVIRYRLCRDCGHKFITKQLLS